jgi:hypothetical protein
MLPLGSACVTVRGRPVHLVSRASGTRPAAELIPDILDLAMSLPKRTSRRKQTSQAQDTPPREPLTTPDRAPRPPAELDLEAAVLGVMRVAPEQAFSLARLQNILVEMFLHQEHLAKALSALHARGAVQPTGEGRYTIAGGEVKPPGPLDVVDGADGEAGNGGYEAKIFAVLSGQLSEGIELEELLARLEAFTLSKPDEAELKKSLETLLQAGRVLKDGNCYWRPVGRGSPVRAALGLVDYFPGIGDCVEWVTGGGFGVVCDGPRRDDHYYVVFNRDPRFPERQKQWIRRRELQPAQSQCI